MAHLSIDDAFDDFGFSTVSEQELKEVEIKLKEEVKATKKKLADREQNDQGYQAKAEKLYKMIMPLLLNLKKNPDQEYIKWPNRSKKIDEFIEKIEEVMSNE